MASSKPRLRVLRRKGNGHRHEEWYEETHSLVLNVLVFESQEDFFVRDRWDCITGLLSAPPIVTIR